MGLRQPKPADAGSKESPHERQKVSKDDFEMISKIGQGNYAVVLLVKQKTTGRFYAMKILHKNVLIEKDEVEHTRTERAILEQANHPFLVKMSYAFQTPEKLYLVMNFANGGELFCHLKKEKRFSEARSRFYAAEITLGLKYLHARDIVYRDLKPENVLLSADGHIVLTDFGLSKMLKEGRTKTFCGTPEYLAPEILLHKGHGKPVDWWSFGTLLYEMIVGIPPFYSTDVREMYDMILHSDLFIPEFVTPHTTDLLIKLLARDPRHRLGSGSDGPLEVMRHLFFMSIDWDRLLRREVPPPFKPDVKGPGDFSQFDEDFVSKEGVANEAGTSADCSQQQAVGSRDQELFNGFTYESSVIHRGLSGSSPAPGQLPLQSSSLVDDASQPSGSVPAEAHRFGIGQHSPGCSLRAGAALGSPAAYLPFSDGHVPCLGACSTSPG
eukprot:TRINITY_DN13973_c0_g1_i1.p1 TRINITY_DN13973_c0_g1~~TRINITY_DN13973_c0_g1_i1.p1  ORF type:complete len:439 (+),score=125.15 TRINITY_DN13973_c0_g1_i1:170-1486(+)